MRNGNIPPEYIGYSRRYLIRVDSTVVASPGTPKILFRYIQELIDSGIDTSRIEVYEKRRLSKEHRLIA